MVHTACSGKLGASVKCAGYADTHSCSPQEIGRMALLSVFQQGRSSSGKEVVGLCHPENSYASLQS
jgi:hypothetical protein